MQHFRKDICIVAHKGEILESVVTKKIPNKSELSRLMGYDRSTIYRHYADPDLEDGIILKYAKVLKYDFSKEFPHLKDYGFQLNESLTEYKPMTLSEALKEVDLWKDKYIRLLEQYNEMLKNRTPGISK